MTDRIRAVYDINVLVGAVAGGNSSFLVWPGPPPVSDSLFADCVGIANDAVDVALFVSDHVLTNLVRVLVSPDGLGWEAGPTREYVETIVDIAEASGGGVVEPTVRVDNCADWEDNRILELALASEADIIVSDDTDLTAMSPWRGRPVVRPAEFATRVDAARRSRRR
ncbi:MAG: putative toxin-antitoxin system toxin component, PIN family, partial [Actinomycetota bacterium]|nr:putative toxin-antitoxin system toxin component, PIN family [Actinomycetota bacterium]